MQKMSNNEADVDLELTELTLKLTLCEVSQESKVTSKNESSSNYACSLHKKKEIAEKEIGTDLMMKFVIQRDFESVKLAIQLGVDVNLIDSMKNSVLTLACGTKNNEKVIRLLLDAGAKTKHKDSFGLNSFAYLIHNGEDNLVEYFVNKGENVNEVYEDGLTPLIIACFNGDVKIVRILLKNLSCDVNQRDDDGKTPLMICCLKGFCEIAKLLIEVGADVHAIDKSGNSALFFAYRKDYETNNNDCVELLIENGIDANLLNKYGLKYNSK